MSDSKILFVPVSTSSGAGEYYRCLTIAEAIHASNETTNLHFALNGNAAINPPAFVNVHWLKSSPTESTAEVITIIDAEKPDVIVFDSTIRSKPLRAAKCSGARVIFISSRPNRRNKGFALRKLKYIDEHWVLSPPVQHRLSAWEKQKTRLTKTKTRFLHSIMPASEPTRRRDALAELGLSESHYVLFASGGGGGQVGDRPTAEVFQAAAREYRARTGEETVFIAGPLAAVTLGPDAGCVELSAVGSTTLADLIAGARLLVCGGGSLIQQAFSMGTPCLAIPAGGKDQPARIREFQQEALIYNAPATAEGLAKGAVALAQSESTLKQLRERIANAGFRNDLPKAVEALLAACEDSTIRQ